MSESVALHAIIDQLVLHQRLAFELTQLLGLSHTEAAHACDCRVLGPVALAVAVGSTQPVREKIDSPDTIRLMLRKSDTAPEPPEQADNATVIVDKPDVQTVQQAGWQAGPRARVDRSVHPGSPPRAIYSTPP